MTPKATESCLTFAFGDAAKDFKSATAPSYAERLKAADGRLPTAGMAKGDVVYFQWPGTLLEGGVRNHAAVFAGHDATGKAMFLQRNKNSEAMLVDENYLRAMMGADPGARVRVYQGHQFVDARNSFNDRRTSFTNEPYAGSVSKFLR